MHLESPEHSWTRDGRTAHAILAGDEDDEESDEISRAVDICELREQQTLIAAGFEDPRCIREERMWLLDEIGNKIVSGQPDRVYIEGNRAFISDFKVGHKDAPAPSLNPQLVCYAVLVAATHGITDITLAIIPAWRPQPPIAQIDAEGIATWRAEIIEAIKESESISPHAEIGDHCLYCPFRTECPEAFAVVEEVSQFTIESMLENPEEAVQKYKKVIHAKGTIKAIEEALKARLALLPDSIPGIRVGEGSMMRTIPGSVPVYERLTSLYDPAVVLAACKWTPAGIAKSICPGKGQQAVKKQLETELADVIVEKTKAGSLELV